MLRGGLRPPAHLRNGGSGLGKGQQGYLGSGEAGGGPALVLLIWLSLVEPLAAPGGSDTRKHHRAAGEVLPMNYLEATSVQQLSN